MAHWYFTVVCKNCGVRDAVMYLGEYPLTMAVAVPASIPADQDLMCKLCHQTHNYASTDLKLAPMPEPPPDGFPRVF